MSQNLPLAQQLAPGADARRNNRQNVFYPQARVTLSVIFEDFGDEPQAPKAFAVQPRKITVYSNSFKEADTWSIEFDARDLPVTPHQIRGGSCEVYLFQAQGVGQLPETVRGKDDPDTEQIEGLNATVVGLFDEYGMEFSDDGRTVTIDGTDYTSLYIAKQWKEGRRVPTGKKLDVILRGLMGEVDTAKAMTLEVRPTGATTQIVGGGSTKTNKKGGAATTAQNYWDVMFDLSIRHGYVIFVEGTKVVIAELESYIQSKKANVRKMAWGRNLSRLRMSRRIGKEQVPIIEVRSYDDKRRKTIKGRFDGGGKQKAVTGLGTKRDEVFVVYYPGIREEKQLVSIAKQIYYLKARSEQKIEIETMDLRDLDGADLIELRTGDALAIGFDPFNAEVELLDGQSEGRRLQTLKDLGYDPVVAAAIAKSFETCSLFRAPFRVREATLEWSHDGGLSISAELENYANIRAQDP